jgi:hypothetical protein
MEKKTKSEAFKVFRGKTVFQEFADFLAKDAGDRDAVYEVAVSETSMVIIRRKDKETTKRNNERSEEEGGGE